MNTGWCDTSNVIKSSIQTSLDAWSHMSQLTKCKVFAMTKSQVGLHPEMIGFKFSFAWFPTNMVFEKI